MLKAKASRVNSSWVEVLGSSIVVEDCDGNGGDDVVAGKGTLMMREEREKDV